MPPPRHLLERMAKLAPLRPDGVTTAALSSQLADAAAALLIASERAVHEHGLTTARQDQAHSARGDDPVLMLTAPIAATRHALRRAGLTLDDLDLIEINEAFASVVLAWQRETGADLARVNVSGGAIAARPPARGHRRTPADHAALRARAHRRQARPADHVRRRRPGQRHDHRAYRLAARQAAQAAYSPAFAGREFDRRCPGARGASRTPASCETAPAPGSRADRRLHRSPGCPTSARSWASMISGSWPPARRGRRAGLPESRQSPRTSGHPADPPTARRPACP